MTERPKRLLRGYMVPLAHSLPLQVQKAALHARLAPRPRRRFVKATPHIPSVSARRSFPSLRRPDAPVVVHVVSPIVLVLKLGSPPKPLRHNTILFVHRRPRGRTRWQARRKRGLGCAVRGRVKLGRRWRNSLRSHVLPVRLLRWLRGGVVHWLLWDWPWAGGGRIGRVWHVGGSGRVMRNAHTVLERRHCLRHFGRQKAHVDAIERRQHGCRVRRKCLRRPRDQERRRRQPGCVGDKRDGCVLVDFHQWNEHRRSCEKRRGSAGKGCERAVGGFGQLRTAVRGRACRALAFEIALGALERDRFHPRLVNETHG
eukprot:Opistho-1_new@39834